MQTKTLRDNHCQEFKPQSIEGRRKLLAMNDRELNVDTCLSRFDADFAYLTSTLELNRIANEVDVSGINIGL